MTKLTTMETQLLNLIANSEYVDGTPTQAADVQVWWWPEDASIKLGWHTGQISGVVSSLIQKGLVSIIEDEPDHDIIAFTDTGFDAWKATQ